MNKLFFIWISTRKLTSSVLGWDPFCVRVQWNSDRQRERDRWRKTRWRQQGGGGAAGGGRTLSPPEPESASSWGLQLKLNTHKPWSKRITSIRTRRTRWLWISTRPPFCSPPSFRGFHGARCSTGPGESLSQNWTTGPGLPEEEVSLSLPGVGVTCASTATQFGQITYRSARKVEICYVGLRFWILLNNGYSGHRSSLRYVTLRYLTLRPIAWNTFWL